MTMTGKERAELRGECNGLKATVHVGAHGLTDALIGALDDALRTHELVKVAMGKPVELPAREAARQLGVAVNAEVIQVIGKTTTLYRYNPELKRKDGSLPPWKG
jgi:RNA-binding protein